VRAEQFYAMKYGTVPVVHGTGGSRARSRSGMVKRGAERLQVHGYKAANFLAAIQRALAVFPDKAAWQTLMRNGMAQTSRG